MAIQILSPSTISCPFPDNLTPLSPNGFIFAVAKLPDMNFFCQQVDLPSVDLGSIDQATPMVVTPVAGEMMTFAELHVQFLVDSEMKNYKAIFDWMNGLGFPLDNKQYTDYIASDTNHFSELSKSYSDGTLSILTGQNNVASQLQFADLFPTSLGSLTFQSTNTDVQYLIGNATFKYTYYKFL